MRLSRRRPRRSRSSRIDAAHDTGLWEATLRLWDGCGDCHQAAYARWRHAEALEALARRARLDLGDDHPSEAAPNALLQQLQLTPRELEVLALLGDGMTNREIAGELFISDKTASVHVSRILTKLSVPNRAAAAATAQRLGVERMHQPSTQ